MDTIGRPYIAFGHYGAKDDIGGVTTWLERLLLRLHNDGIPVCLYLQHFGSNTEESNILHPLRKAGIPVDIEPRSPYIDGDVRGTLAFLNRYQPVIFMPQCLEAMYYAAGMTGNLGLPWVMTIHSDDPVYWAIAEIVPPESNGGLMVGVSDHICQRTVREGLVSQPQTIPYGVPIPKNVAYFSDNPFRVAFSGRIVEEQKRISLVLEAMAQACRRDSRIECWLIGDGSALSSSKQWVLDRDLGDRIHFLGRLEPVAVQSKLVQCQAILLMSDYEGLPVALLEAMAIGVVPVVRSIPSGIPELVKNNETGFLVDEAPEQAANAIIHLVNHPELWLQYSEASKLLVSKYYSEEICYQRWLKVISELSDRSTVCYPIPIPKILSLPPVHPNLTGRDIRKPTLYEHVMSKVYRIKGKVKKMLWK
jgi:colanic acid/amylovoran biosynthesis glycosyltransferase